LALYLVVFDQNRGFEMSSVKRWGEENGWLPGRSQAEQDQYYDDDELIGYRCPEPSSTDVQQDVPEDSSE